MIPAFTVGVLIGAIIGAAAVAWRHAATIAPPVEQHVQWSALGIGDTNIGVASIDADRLREIFKHLGRGKFFEIKGH
jgi:hypothetical protein